MALLHFLSTKCSFCFFPTRSVAHLLQRSKNVCVCVHSSTWNLSNKFAVVRVFVSLKFPLKFCCIWPLSTGRHKTPIRMCYHIITISQPASRIIHYQGGKSTANGQQTNQPIVVVGACSLSGWTHTHTHKRRMKNIEWRWKMNEQTNERQKKPIEELLLN